MRHHTMDDIAAMTPEEFTENWNNGTIVDSCLAELGSMGRPASVENALYDL